MFTLVYICQNCGLSVSSERQPRDSGCSVEKYHKWKDVGEAGNEVYNCSNCGIVVNTKRTPRDPGCPKSTYHKWKQLK